MPILAEYRPLYKITQVLLILYLCSRGKKSSLIKLHLFSWVMKDDKRKSILLASANKNKILFGVWGVDPSVNYAIQYSLGEGLLERVGVSYKLSKKGESFISEINEGDVISGEYLFLKSLGLRVTEGMVDEIVEAWS